jgi:5-(carboxyamino)imidazole ribonucleotide synthase
MTSPAVLRARAEIHMHETYDPDILKLVEPARMGSAINPRLGIVGGGQLAKMTALAGLQLGCDVVVLERNNYSPAANLASHSIVGDWDNPEALFNLASHVDVVTLENEFVDARSLRALEEGGYPLFPTAGTIALVQDKYVQKQTLAAAGLPVPRFVAVANLAEVEQAGSTLGWPLLLKARRNAYDGKGNATLRTAADAAAAWAKLGGDRGRELFVEEFCDFTTELAIIVTRSRNGASVSYPLVETLQRDHLCHIVKAPAPVPPEIATRATEVARQAVAAVGAVGSFGVEMFLTRAGHIVLNELAPRVHNSGHYTIEACLCSQFENHVRAVLGWPLGSTAMVAPAAVMVNLLGTGRATGHPQGLQRALAVAGARVHIYGKAMSGAGRKMGHVTALGATLDEALERATQAATEIRFGGTR